MRYGCGTYLCSKTRVYEGGNIFNIVPVFSRGSKHSKSSTGDEDGRGPEKRRPTTFYCGNKVRLCDMGSEVLCAVRIVSIKGEGNLNIEPVVPHGGPKRVNLSNDDENGHGQAKTKPAAFC